MAKAAKVAGPLKYTLAVGAVLAACALRWSLPDILGPTPFLAFFPAVALAAMLGGFWPGVLATVLSLACRRLLFDDTPGNFGLGDPISLFRGGIFIAGGLIISLMAHRLRSAVDAQSRLAAIVESTDDGILSIDLNGQICTWNAAAENM